MKNTTKKTLRIPRHPAGVTVESTGRSSMMLIIYPQFQLKLSMTALINLSKAVEEELSRITQKAAADVEDIYSRLSLL